MSILCLPHLLGLHSLRGVPQSCKALMDLNE